MRGKGCLISCKASSMLTVITGCSIQTSICGRQGAPFPCIQSKVAAKGRGAVERAEHQLETLIGPSLSTSMSRILSEYTQIKSSYRTPCRYASIRPPAAISRLRANRRRTVRTLLGQRSMQEARLRLRHDPGALPRN